MSTVFTLLMVGALAFLSVFVAVAGAMITVFALSKLWEVLESW